MFRPRQLDCSPIPGETPRTIFQDEHLWVVHKPAGWLTHEDRATDRPSVTQWCGQPVGVHQRLDVDTTGVLALSRSPKGAKTLQQAMEERRAIKTYWAIVEKAPPQARGEINRPLPLSPRKAAISHYRVLRKGKHGVLLELHPVTGRKHQLRIHLHAIGCPIRGDGRYGHPIDRRASRTLLHCHRLEIPGYAPWISDAPPEFAAYLGLDWAHSRRSLIADSDTTCYRLFHGDGEGAEGSFVDRYGDWLWIQHTGNLDALPHPPSLGRYTVHGAQDRSRGHQQPPILFDGQPAPSPLRVSEHGLEYLVELGQQLSTGLFLDQRPQRTWLAKHASGLRILNTFAHAGGFSIAAATAGASTVSLDLSRRWLERIPNQLENLGLDVRHHDWIYGDVFDWLPRLSRRGEQFDIVILDPPSTSVGKKKKRWSAAKDYPALIRAALPLVAPGGALWTSTNHRGLTPMRFLNLIGPAMPEGTQLERVCPPPIDYPCIGSPQQKTFIWRMDRSSSVLASNGVFSTP